MGSIISSRRRERREWEKQVREMPKDLLDIVFSFHPLPLLLARRMGLNPSHVLIQLELKYGEALEGVIDTHHVRYLIPHLLPLSSKKRAAPIHMVKGMKVAPSYTLLLREGTDFNMLGVAPPEVRYLLFPCLQRIHVELRDTEGMRGTEGMRDIDLSMYTCLRLEISSPARDLPCRIILPRRLGHISILNCIGVTLIFSSSMRVQGKLYSRGDVVVVSSPLSGWTSAC